MEYLHQQQIYIYSASYILPMVVFAHSTESASSMRKTEKNKSGTMVVQILSGNIRYIHSYIILYSVLILLFCMYNELDLNICVTTTIVFRHSYLRECSEWACVFVMAIHSPVSNFQIRTTLKGPVCPEARRVPAPFKPIQDTCSSK